MNRRGAAEAAGRGTGETSDLERAEHRRRLLEIVDRFDPAPDVRAKVLRAMDIEQIRAHHALVARWQARSGAPKRGRGRPRNLEAADLARGCARAWHALKGEMPPKSKNDELSEYYRMALHAFELAGLPGWHKHAVAAANRVAVEREEQRPSPADGWAVMRITQVRSEGRQLSEDELRAIGFGLTADELRAMGVFWTPPRPRRGRKSKKVDFRP